MFVLSLNASNLRLGDLLGRVRTGQDLKQGRFPTSIGTTEQCSSCIIHAHINNSGFRRFCRILVGAVRTARLKVQVDCPEDISR